MRFSTGSFTDTLPRTGVGRIQSHRAVCAYVYVVVEWIALPQLVDQLTV